MIQLWGPMAQRTSQVAVAEDCPYLLRLAPCLAAAIEVLSNEDNRCHQVATYSIGDEGLAPMC